MSATRIAEKFVTPVDLGTAKPPSLAELRAPRARREYAQEMADLARGLEVPCDVCGDPADTLHVLPYLYHYTACDHLVDAHGDAGVNALRLLERRIDSLRQLRQAPA